MLTKSAISLRRLCLAIVTLISAYAAPAFARAQPVAIAPQPLIVESLGFKMPVPEGAVIQSSSGTTTQVQITPPGNDSNWMITVQSLRKLTPDTTTQQVADVLRNELLASAGIKDSQGRVTQTSGRVLDQTPNLILGGIEASRFYVLLPSPGQQAAVVIGHTVFPLPGEEGGRFATISLVTTQPELVRTQALYETLVADAQFVDTTAEIRTGTDLLAKLTEDDYREIFSQGIDVMLRYYEPADTGVLADDKEHGYRRVRAWIGSRGELDPSRPERNWLAAEREQGYLVRVDFRGLDNDRIVDISSTYFESFDFEEEAWITKMAIRAGGNPAVYTEMGLRTGQSMSVTTSGPGVDQSLSPFIPDRGYLSNVRRYMLPWLLARVGIEVKAGFYEYLTTTESVSLRQIDFKKSRHGEGWIMTTQRADAEGEEVASYTADGDLLSAELPDGRVFKPMAPDRLMRLWQQKNLPVGNPR